MAKGYEQHQERLRLLGLLGKPLARRSGRRCELCEATQVALKPFEVPPVPSEPELERTLLLCQDCHLQIEDSRERFPARWRCLEGAVWSTEPAVQVMAVRLLKRLARSEAWAAEALEAVDLEPEIVAWAGLAEVDE
jgi:protein PhnA